MKKVSGRYADISNRLRAIREYYGMSSTEFAEEIGRPLKSYSQWESGENRISIDGALSLRHRFGITLDFIYDGNLDALPFKIANALSSSPLVNASNKSTDTTV